MIDVNKVFITKEVADKLNITSSYLVKLGKKLQNEGKISGTDMRGAGKSTYLFNQNAIDCLKENLKK